MQRIAFIDQLKGLAMLMVVFGHLLQFCFGVKTCMAEVILETFDLPLFFLISGYFCFRTSPRFSDIAKKARAYLVPFVAVGSFFFFTHGQIVVEQMVINGGGKYWFLYFLFLVSAVCIVLNIFVCWLERGKPKWWLDALVYGSAFLAFAIVKLRVGELPHWLPIGKFATYFRYFVVGMMLRKYTRFYDFFMRSDWLYALGFIVFVVGVYYSSQTNSLLIMLSTLGALVVLWRFMSSLEHQDNIALRILTYIGQYTLSIYVFHYFFLFDLHQASAMLVGSSQFVLQIAACMFACLLIVPCCILVDRMIERSKWLRLLILVKR